MYGYGWKNCEIIKCRHRQNVDSEREMFSAS